MKKWSKPLMVVAVVIIAIVSLVACTAPDGNYFKKVSSYKFWTNTGETAIPQTAIHNIIDEHVNNVNGKEKKVLVIGFDGGRADGLVNIIKSGAEMRKDVDYSGHNDDQLYSGVNHIRKTGGTYISYAGGEKGKDTQQHTSTGPGWSAMSTGAWGKDNGMTNNGMTKNLEYKTIMLKLAENKDMQTAFIAQWGEHFDLTYTKEIDYLKANPSIDMRFTKIEDDFKMYEHLKASLTVDNDLERDVIFTIFEATDHNGHGTGYGDQNSHYVNAIKNIDMYAYGLIETIENRSTYAEEDWLILLTSEHGGIGTGHGGQTLEERTTFIVSNKVLDTKHYSQGYNGYKCK